MIEALLSEHADAILKGVCDLVFLFSRDGTLLDYHAQVSHPLYLPNDFVGKKVKDILPPAVAERFMGAIRQVGSSPEAVVVDYELLVTEKRYFQARFVDARDARVLAFVRDVTESRRMRGLAGRLIANQESELAGVARELHDNIGQQLAFLNLEIDRIGRESKSSKIQSQLEKLSVTLARLSTDVSRLSHELHPPTLGVLGLVPSLRSLCEEASRQAGMEIPFVYRDVPEQIDPPVSICMYRIAQEALHNVVKHSDAPDASVHLVGEPQLLCLYVTDSGVGFDEDKVRGGIGLVSIRERVRFLSGSLAIDSGPESGTRIAVRIPLDAAMTGDIQTVPAAGQAAMPGDQLIETAERLRKSTSGLAHETRPMSSTVRRLKAAYRKGF